MRRLMKKNRANTSKKTELRSPNSQQAEEAIRTLLLHLGEDSDREGLAKTPHRVVKSLLELTSGYSDDPKSILSTTFNEKCDEMVVVRDVKFWSLCEHHMLPFYGTA